MKHVTTRSLVLAIIMLGFLAAAPMAYAVTIHHNGSICQNSTPADATSIEYLSRGIRSLKTLPTAVICPLTRQTSLTNGATATVFITHTGTQTTACLLYSYTRDGRVLGTAPSSDLTFSGFMPITLPLGAGKSDATSNYSVRCSIPGNGNATIHGIDLTE
jgi:hypothetical protein